jgi:hypothetical protein
MCSRSAPTQVIVTNETTGWLCCNFVVYVVLDGADQLAGNAILAVYYFSPPFFYCQITCRFRGMLTYC